MSFEKIIGIDPGKSGGIAIKSNSGVVVGKMPDLEQLQKVFGEQTFGYENQTICFVEKVQIWMQDSEEDNRGKQFRIQQMMNNYSYLKSCLIFCKIPFIEVHPLTWQSYLKLRKKGTSRKDKKERFKRFAAQIFPGINVTAWSADALCILRFGLEKLELDSKYINDNIVITGKDIFS